MKIKSRLLSITLVLFLLCGSWQEIDAQKLLHQVQLNAGLISNPGADLYIGKLDYIPQFKFGDDAFRAGLNGGVYYTRKDIEAAIGVNASVRLKRLSTLNDNFTLGGIYFRAGFDYATTEEKIITGAIQFEFTQLAINATYGRELEFDNNWITFGFSFLLTKAEKDPDE